jgi:hypothetical protein
MFTLIKTNDKDVGYFQIGDRVRIIRLTSSHRVWRDPLFRNKTGTILAIRTHPDPAETEHVVHVLSQGRDMFFQDELEKID